MGQSIDVPTDNASPLVSDIEIDEFRILETEIEQLEAQSGHLSASQAEHLEACERRYEELLEHMVLSQAAV
jgi:hypothetical protein